MAAVKYFISEAKKKNEVDAFLGKKLERSGYGGVTISKTPLGTHIVIYTMRPGMVIGRAGGMIKELSSFLENSFKLSNPQISVSEIEIPEFNAHIVASKIVATLEKGIHFRRAGFWALNQVMEAGAVGAEIVISGKMRTDRARYEKFRAGYLPKCGDIALKNVQKAVAHVQLKPGIMGIRVSIFPPGVNLEENKKHIKTEKESPKLEQEKIKETILPEENEASAKEKETN